MRRYKCSGCLGTGTGTGARKITRKLKNKVSPIYPELARRMNIVGVVKVQITVEKNGAIKNNQTGLWHPILAGPPWTQSGNGATNQVRKKRSASWSFHFDPCNEEPVPARKRRKRKVSI